MGVFDRAYRFAVVTQAQHPYKHTLSDFAYSNPALPGVSNINSAFNYLVAALYPNTEAAVATPGDLPTGVDTPNVGDVAPTLNDYRVVNDDGDGKQAAYRYEQREGDVAAQWYKVMDMDWSNDSILAELQDITLPLYVSKKGTSDLDASGNAVAGLYAGQTIYGGDTAGQNLTLNANSGDGVGAESGYVQIDSQFRPSIDDTFSNGTVTERWTSGFYSTSLVVDTLSMVPGSITDTSGQISFDNENLLTTGNITGAILTGTQLVADDTSDSMTLVPGTITDTTGAISFGAANLSTTGTFGAGVTTLTDTAETLIFDPNVGGTQAEILSSLGLISFGDENLITTGSLTVGSLSSGLLDVDNIRLDGNTISTTDLNGNLILVPNGTGGVDIQKTLTALGATFTGTVTVNGQLNADNIRIDANAISTTDANGDMTLSPNGTGSLITTSSFIPNADGTKDLGSTGARFNDLFLSGGVSDGTNEISIAETLSLRSTLFRDVARTQPAQTGDSLFFDAANSIWLASVPDTEISHSTIGGITTGDAGHTQFAMLAGRAGGQTIAGGTAASEDLTLQSTTDGTKGNVRFADSLVPDTSAAYAGSWSGLDLGSSSLFINDIYSRGEFKGLRLENVLSSALPSFSGQTPGRLYYATDNGKAYVDTGAAIKVLGVGKFSADQTFNGTDVQKDVDVSADISDARTAIIQLKDNANDFENLNVTIKATSASNVRITTNTALPAGSYRLVVIE